MKLLDQDSTNNTRRIKEALHTRRHTNLIKFPYLGLPSFTPLTEPSSCKTTEPSSSQFPCHYSTIVHSHSTLIIQLSVLTETLTNYVCLTALVFIVGLRMLLMLHVHIPSCIYTAHVSYFLALVPTSYNI